MTDQPYKPEPVVYGCPLCNEPNPHEHDITPTVPGGVGLLDLGAKIDQLAQAVGRVEAKVGAQPLEMAALQLMRTERDQLRADVERLTRERDARTGDPLSIRCAECGAEPGQECRGLAVAHLIRVMEADRDAQKRRADSYLAELNATREALGCMPEEATPGAAKWIVEQRADAFAKLADAEARAERAEKKAANVSRDTWAKLEADLAAANERVRELEEDRRPHQVPILRERALRAEARNARLVDLLERARYQLESYALNASNHQHAENLSQLVAAVRAALADQPKGEGANE